MNGWNRLFVVVAVCWALVVPFLVMTEVNRPVEAIFNLCTTAAYENYGTGDARVRADMDKYRSERDECISAWSHNFLSIQKSPRRSSGWETGGWASQCGACS